MPASPATITFSILASGDEPLSGLLLDGSGNLFGTTAEGSSGNGSVFEVPRTSTGYGPTMTIASFNGSNGNKPEGGLVADAAGNLYGTTAEGGASGAGSIYELPKTSAGYGPVTTLFSFNTADGAVPASSLLIDAAGDLIGTASNGGAYGYGNVFELPKASTGFGALSTIVSFKGTVNGAYPEAGLISDAAGDLFGATNAGGSLQRGSVFEIPKATAGYGTLITLATFNNANGASPLGTLTADAAGDLFGTTFDGGAYGYGSVFEIPKAGSGFGALTTLASFNDASAPSTGPRAGVIVDAVGDLFGTTFGAGTSSSDGTVYEVPKTSQGYGPLTTLVAFNGSNGAEPFAGLTADAAGNLFGTTSAGGSGGVVFEIQGAYVPALRWSGPTVGTSSAAGTAVDLRGTVADTGSTVTIYNGAATAANKVGNAVVAADGTWSLSTTLPTGRYDAFQAVATSAAGKTTTAKSTFVLQTGITGQLYTSTTTLFDSNGQTSGIVDTKANGATYTVLTYAADRSYTIAYPGITGQTYTTLVNNYAANETKVGVTHSGITGEPYTATTETFKSGTTQTDYTTYYNADGSVYAILTRTPDGDLVMAHPKVTGEPYTSFTNVYTPASALLGSSFAGYTGHSYDTVDQSYAANGKPIFKALTEAGVITETTSFDASGVAQTTTSYGGPAGQSVTNAGLFEKAGTADTWIVSPTFVNSGTIDGESGVLQFKQSVANTGTIDVGADAKIAVAGALTGSGAVHIHGTESMFEIGAAASNTVGFTDASAATLILDDAPDFTGRIAGFGTQSVIDVKGFFTSTSLSYASNQAQTGGVLTLTDNAKHASFALTGNYTAADFAAPITDTNAVGILIRHT